MGGEVITVNTLDDVTDFSGPQQVSNLPGPDGRISFREAVTAANNTSGPQTIAFAIPTADFWLVAGVGLLRLEQGAFFLNDSGTTVDFSTQTANVGDTNPYGPEIGIYGLEPNGAGVAAIYINGDNCVINGLGAVYQRGYAVRIVGNQNRVTGCKIEGPLHAAVSISGYVGGATPKGNVVGGTTPAEGNSLVGLVIDGPADSNRVTGNSLLVGVQVRGATQFGVIARDNRIGGPTPSERNVISGAGYYGEEGFPTGDQVSVVDADNTVIEGNYIGTTAEGLNAYPQIGPVGVEIRDSRGTTVRGNLIAGLRVAGIGHASGLIFGQAIHVDAVNADTDGTVIEDNTIGLGANGVTPIVTRAGIVVSPQTTSHHAFGTRIASNHIASVETTGILVAGQENGVSITGNSIHDCGALGIDLAMAANADGSTPNDPGDGDTGGNHLQNFPLLQSAITTGSSVQVQGTLDSSPSAQYAIELFASPSCDPSGFGEGATFLGSTTATTDSSGHASFSKSLPAGVSASARVTATATQLSTGDTSEFSACLVATQAGPPVANASAVRTSGSAPLIVEFSAAGSSDPSGIKSYEWSFGDGDSSAAANPVHIYLGNGTYIAKLTVTSNSNLSASDTETIVVSDALVSLISTEVRLSVLLHGSEIAVTGTVALRNAHGATVQNSMVSAIWTTPGGGMMTESATTDAAGIATFSTTGGPGTYTLTVTNATGTGYEFDPANSVLTRSITQPDIGRRRPARGSH